MFMERIAGFDWDIGNLQKCQKHGVSAEEIEYVLSQPVWVFPDPQHSQSEERFKGIGRNASGRAIFVVFTFRRGRSGRLIRPISARYMHRKEVDHYEKEITGIQE